jgi:hypothetical protein
MLKKSLFVVAALAMLAVTAQAGTIKVHTWPTTFVAQELATIPVYMDVGYYVEVKDQNKIGITLSQKTVKDFEGCTDISVENNFALTLTCSISQDGPVGGTFKCDFGGGVGSLDLEPGGNTVHVCAYLTGADVKNSSPTANVKVANVKLFVVPRV